MPIYYVDGKFVPSDEAVIPVNDLSVIRGIGVFDLFRTYNGKPYKLEEHIERLKISAEQIGLSLPWPKSEITSIVEQTIKKNTIKNASVRIIVTGGSSYDFMTASKHPRLLILVNSTSKLPEWCYTEGIKIITWESERLFPLAKSIDYISASIALRKAKGRKCVEALYVTKSGLVLECTTSNIFAFIQNRLVTPGRSILPGITRKTVMKIANEIFDIKVRDLQKHELLTAQEVFITGTNKGVVPVIQIDSTIVGTGCPGYRTVLITKMLDRDTKNICQTA